MRPLLQPIEGTSMVTKSTDALYLLVNASGLSLFRYADQKRVRDRAVCTT